MAEHHEHPTCPTCGRATRGSPTGPQPPVIGERTPEMVRAEQRLERRQSEYDQAAEVFNIAASGHWSAKATSSARTRIVMVDGGASLREVGGTDPAELAAFAEAEENAKAAMDAAGRELTEARLAHHEAARAARAAAVA